jgi:SAM-dependent methyltransferase
MNVSSPLVENASSTEMSKLSVKRIIDSYKSDFNIDVSSYFEGLSEISIYQCEASKLKFYYPFNLAGDEYFYDDLSKKYSNYYSKWKWEHEHATTFLNSDDNVLEVGCGNGYFLQKIKNSTSSVTGLDFNPSSIKFGKENGISIVGESIQQHSKYRSSYYDYIAAFQLFEHVNEVGNFINSTIACLKKGGRLIIGVPDNDSPIFKYMPYHTLNLPPHHMLLWDEKSLSYLSNKYNLKLVEITNQPARANFKSASYKSYLEYYLGKNLLTNVIHLTTRFVVKALPFFTKGQTVLAIFEKK